jgi:hypothetical protein
MHIARNKGRSSHFSSVLYSGQRHYMEPSMHIALDVDLIVPVSCMQDQRLYMKLSLHIARNTGRSFHCSCVLFTGQRHYFESSLYIARNKGLIVPVSCLQDSYIGQFFNCSCVLYARQSGYLCSLTGGKGPSPPPP